MQAVDLHTFPGTITLNGNVETSAVRGPLGHPADGEFEVRPLTSFVARVRAAPAGLTVEFEGRTEAGSRVCHFEGAVDQRDIPPWAFHVRFEVGRDKIQSFLDLGEDALKGVLAVLDAGGAWPTR